MADSWLGRVGRRVIRKLNEDGGGGSRVDVAGDVAFTMGVLQQQNIAGMETARFAAAGHHFKSPHDGHRELSGRGRMTFADPALRAGYEGGAS